MKIKILKGEHLFLKNGTHICDEKGIAQRAQEDVECDISFSHTARVKEIIKADRLNRGLDENGIPIPEPVIEEPSSPVEE
jgi:hypothetical protein